MNSAVPIFPCFQHSFVQLCNFDFIGTRFFIEIKFLLVKNRHYLIFSTLLAIYASYKSYDNLKKVSASLSGYIKKIEAQIEWFSYRQSMYLGF